ncbi:LysR family transcriptional regulator [Robbsia sp. KACC 23696]|uniref:LysR family transcriptional regulator n=1 Tax=Robbsia sp. KACC 23696 TaxID=3149231 RepID=UPI00325BFD7D
MKTYGDPSKAHDVKVHPAAALENEVSERAMRYLHAVASQGGVRNAADWLGINASVVSRQIAALERELHAAVIERQGRNVVLTEIGDVLVEFYRDRQRRQQDLAVQLEAFRSLKRGRLRIGFGEGFLEGLLTVALRDFSATYPDITIELLAASTPDVIKMVRDDVVDLGVCVRSAHDPAINGRLFTVGPLCAILHPTHRLARQPRIAVDALANERLIFMSDRFGVQRYLQSILDEQRLSVIPAYRCDMFATAQSLVVAGLGIAFMSARAAQARIDKHEVVAVPLDHAYARDFSGELVTRAGRRLSPAGQHLWKVLASVLEGR